MQTTDRTEGPGDGTLGKLRPGDEVEVRSVDEILATLDETGRLDGLPFMPEMLQFAGKRIPIYRRAIKACDTIANTGMYRMERAVHLEGTRCDGSAHAGCQASCLLYWKEAWLKPVGPDARGADRDPADAAAMSAAAPASATVETLDRATRVDAAGSDEPIYSCQATDLPKAAPTHIRGWDLGQSVRDVRVGNARVWPMVKGLLILGFNKYQNASKRHLPQALRIHRGQTYPFVDGAVVGPTPKGTLDLQPGELVEVKSKEEIFATIDESGHNRGLRFDVEMLKYCGTRARVLRRVNRIVDEKTGRVIQWPSDCIILEGVVCAADYHQFCPRAIYPYWREIWLRRVGETS
jgi:hypothetical protein